MSSRYLEAFPIGHDDKLSSSFSCRVRISGLQLGTLSVAALTQKTIQHGLEGYNN